MPDRTAMEMLESEGKIRTDNEMVQLAPAY